MCASCYETQAGAVLTGGGKMEWNSAGETTKTEERSKYTAQSCD